MIVRLIISIYLAFSITTAIAFFNACLEVMRYINLTCLQKNISLNHFSRIKTFLFATIVGFIPILNISMFISCVAMREEFVDTVSKKVLDYLGV